MRALWELFSLRLSTSENSVSIVTRFRPSSHPKDQHSLENTSHSPPGPLPKTLRSHNTSNRNHHPRRDPSDLHRAGTPRQPPHRGPLARARHHGRGLDAGVRARPRGVVLGDAALHVLGDVGRVPRLGGDVAPVPPGGLDGRGDGGAAVRARGGPDGAHHRAVGVGVGERRRHAVERRGERRGVLARGPGRDGGELF